MESNKEKRPEKGLVMYIQTAHRKGSRYFIMHLRPHHPSRGIGWGLQSPLILNSAPGVGILLCM